MATADDSNYDFALGSIAPATAALFFQAPPWGGRLEKLGNTVSFGNGPNPESTEQKTSGEVPVSSTGIGSGHCHGLKFMANPDA